MRVIERYADYVTTRKQATLLPKYLGLFTVTMGSEKTCFVVMNNVFAAYLDIHQRFDLKGSTAGRKASQKERQKKQAVYKDMDLVGSHTQLLLGKEAIDVLMQDADWLASAGVMDYSLLVGIHVKQSSQPSHPLLTNSEVIPEEQLALYTAGSANRKKAHPGVVYVETDAMVAYIGIIDILTEYGLFKHFETFFTGTLACRNVSAQPPKKYARRFKKFLLDNIRTNDEVVVTGLAP